MKKRLQKLFGVDQKGRPSLPNSRRQLFIGGAICLAIWPGIAVLLQLSGQLDPGEEAWVFLSPWLLVTLLGVYLVGQAGLAECDWPRFETLKQKRELKKERRK